MKIVLSNLAVLLVYFALFVVIDVFVIHGSDAIRSVASSMFWLMLSLPAVSIYITWTLASKDLNNKQFRVLLSAAIPIGITILGFFLLAFASTKLHILLGGKL